MKNPLGILFCIVVSLAVSSSQAQIPPPGGGGGGTIQGNWEVQPLVLSGVNEYFGYTYGPGGSAVPTHQTMQWGGAMIANACNGTHYSLTARMVSEGTITIKVKWIGAGTAPSKVWIKASSSASFDVGLPSAFPEGGGGMTATGSCSNGLGDAVAATQTGGISTGQEYFPVTVGQDGVAQKTVSISADSNVTGPYSSAMTTFSANWTAPDPFVFDPSEMAFTNTAGPIDTENTSFFNVAGQTFPVQGWRKTAGGVQEAFPVHYIRATQPATTLTFLAKVNWVEPTPSVDFKLAGYMSYTGAFFSWPEVSGQASPSLQSKSFSASQPLLDKIHTFTYSPEWPLRPDEPFSVQTRTTGSNTVYVTWGPPIGEVVTLKRLSWAVNAVASQPVQTDRPGEENAADRIWMALPQRFGSTTALGEEWRLLDPNPYYTGECDEHARLMVKAMHILGIPAEPSLVYASTDASVEAPESRDDFSDHNNRWLVMDFSVGPGFAWNGFEGVCKTAGRVYSVVPRRKGFSIIDFFNTLPFEQYWCVTNNDVAPGNTRYGPNWGPNLNFAPVFEPKPLLVP